MVRHIFMAAVKEDVTNEKIQEIVKGLQALRIKYPSLQAGVNLGWFNPRTQITLTVDFKDRNEFEDFINSPEHIHIVNTYFDCYKQDMIFTSQFELR